jgi:hypothetical protein
VAVSTGLRWRLQSASSGEFAGPCTLISKGKHLAAQILKARILLKADVSEAGEGWSDSRIVKVLSDLAPTSTICSVGRDDPRGLEDADRREGTGEDVQSAVIGGNMLVAV